MPRAAHRKGRWMLPLQTPQVWHTSRSEPLRLTCSATTGIAEQQGPGGAKPLTGSETQWQACIVL